MFIFEPQSVPLLYVFVSKNDTLTNLFIITLFIFAIGFFFCLSEEMIIAKEEFRIQSKAIHDKIELQKNFFMQFRVDFDVVNDVFAGAWLMSVPSFMTVKTGLIGTKSDGAIHPLNQNYPSVRKTRNWLDFSVQYMIHWFDNLRISSFAGAFSVVLKTLDVSDFIFTFLEYAFSAEFSIRMKY